MKRVTDRSDLASKQVPEYVSGCRQFEGEDLGKYIILSILISIKYSSPRQNARKRINPEGMDQGAKERALVD
jgi:hypothetical protein